MSEDDYKFEDRLLPYYYDVPEHYQPPPFNELKNNTEYPNLNSDDFRTRQPPKSSELLNSFEHIDQNDEGTILLATNSYFDRYWSGNIFGFDNFEDIESVDKASFSAVKRGGTVTTMKYLNTSMFLFTNSDSRIEIWSTKSAMRNPSGYCIYKIGDSLDVLGIANDMKLFKDQNRAITGSSTGMIQIWDYGSSDLYCCQEIYKAHSKSINGLSMNPTSDQEFISCSNDRSILHWDLRLVSPGARAVYENHKTAFNTVHWGSEIDNGNMIQAGDNCGDIYSFDIRMPNQVASIFSVTEGKEQRPIKKIVYNKSYFGVVDCSCTARIYKHSGKEENWPVLVEMYTTSGPLIHDLLWDKLNDSMCFIVGENKTYKKLNVPESQI